MSDPLEAAMELAVRGAAAVRHLTRPNPWVGCVVLPEGGGAYLGATSPAGGPHAERHSLAAAGPAAAGATLVTTLEPCGHHGRTGPCTEAIIAAGVRRVVIGVLDPDPLVAGRGAHRLREAGIEVDVGVKADLVEQQLRPYLHQRRTGRPYVVAKLAGSLDGRTAAPDGTSQWITSRPARTDAHRLRAESDVIIVGSGTVRADDPSLTVRHWQPPGSPEGHRAWSDGSEPTEVIQPRRLVLGQPPPPQARIQPCDNWSASSGSSGSSGSAGSTGSAGSLHELIAHLGDQSAIQVMVEGGASTVAGFHRAGLIDRYVLYLAPVVFGGDDGKPLMSGHGAPSIEAVTRGRIVGVEHFDPDLRIDVEMPTAGVPEHPQASSNQE